MLKIVKFCVLIVFLFNSAYAKSEKISDIDKIKKAIVTINSRVPVSAYQNTGSWSGTGFIVDNKNGYLITNNHVVGKGAVGTYFITFHNGQQTEAKLVYYDMYADFAILQINPKDFPEQIETIEFTNQMPQIGSDVFIVGNTEGQGFSFHSGYLSDLYEINGEMPQGTYVINMNTAGGASGSPILNSENKAIGVLYGGGGTYSLALKGSYVNYVLSSLQSGKGIPGRKHIGVIATLYSLDKAVKHRNFSKKDMNDYIKKLPDARNRVIEIESILPGGSAENILKAGDILWEINGKTIGADLTVFDQEMNNAKSNQIQLTIIRNGQKLQKELNLYNLEEHKISRMLDFAGGLFFESDDFVSAKAGIPIGRVAIANVQTGSSFSNIPQMYTQNYKSIYRIMIESINGQPVNSLNEMITATSRAIAQKYVSLEYKNFQPYYPKFDINGFISAHENFIEDITFDSIDTKPRILKFDDKKLEWVSEEL